MNLTTQLEPICPKFPSSKICNCKTEKLVTKGKNLYELSTQLVDIGPRLYFTDNESIRTRGTRFNQPSTDTYGVIPLRWARPC